MFQSASAKCLQSKAPLCPHLLCPGSHHRGVLYHRVAPGLLQYKLNLEVHLQPLQCSSCMQTSGPSTRSKTNVFSSPQISDTSYFAIQILLGCVTRWCIMPCASCLLHVYSKIMYILKLTWKR